MIESFKNLDKESLIEMILSKIRKVDLNHILKNRYQLNNKKINSKMSFYNIGVEIIMIGRPKDFLSSFKIDKNDIYQVEVMNNFSFFLQKNNSVWF